MHIALIVERFAPGGGVEGAAWHLARGLAAEGDRVSVFARSGGVCDGVERIGVNVPTAWQPLRVWLFAHRASAAAQACGASLVHSFARTRRQHIYRAGGGCHADYLSASYPPMGRALRRWSPRHRVLLHLESKIYADRAQTIQCNSRFVRDALVKRHGIDAARTVVTYNGVDLDRFRVPDLEFRAARRKAEGVGKERIWLFAGSGFRRKGLDVAIGALAASHQPDTRLWVAGGDAVAPWQRLAGRLGVGGRVRFLGHRDLATVFPSVDGLILPTRYDAFANVCLEAAASGRAVLTSASNGAAEVLGAGGIVIRDGEDAAAFGVAMDTDRSHLEAMGRAARRVAEGFGWGRYVAEQRALYARVAAA